MHTSIVESKGTYYEGLDRYTYWILPVYPVVLAGWFGIVGFGLFTMRALSVLFGCVLLIAMYAMVSRLMKDRAVGLITAVLLAIDFVLIRGGAVGRMDLMCAALGFSGIAMYLVLRDRSVLAAFAAGHVLVAIAVFTHPNGILYFIGLLLLAAVWDLRRIRVLDLVAGAIPYLLLLGAWALYISHDPALFTRQFGGNASGRMGGFYAPIDALKRELLFKYLGANSGQLLFKVGLVVPYLLGVVGALSIRELRRHKGIQTLFALTAVFFVYNWLFDGVKIYLYVVHLAPLYVALLASTIRWLWMQCPRWRAGVAAGVGALGLIQIAGTIYTVRRNSYETVYRPVIAAVRERAHPGDLVMGSAELAFGLGFDGRLVDDARLGYTSGKRADVIVLDRRYQEAIAAAADGDRIQALLARYTRVASVADCEVFVRRGKA